MNLTVGITIWPRDAERIGYLKQCLESLEKNLVRYPGDFVSIVVSSESSNVCIANRASLGILCVDHNANLRWRAERPSLPNNNNELFRLANGPLLYLQDDWILTRPLDIRPALAKLEEPDCAGVRLAAFHCKYLDDSAWPEIDLPRSVWPYGDNPALWSKRFFEKCGPFEEDVGWGYHEVRMGESLRKSGLKAYVPREVAADSYHYFSTLGTPETSLLKYFEPFDGERK